MRDEGQKGIAHLAAIFALVVLLVITGIGWKVYKNQKTKLAPSQNQSKTAASVGAATELALPAGYTAKVFAKDIPKARDLAFSPGGTLLVSQTNDNKVLALPDANKDGVADSVKEVATGNTTHGLAFTDQYLFVAEVDKVVRYKWDESSLTANFDKQLLSLGISGHSLRTLAVFPDGRLYISVGSSCNACIEPNPFFATVVETNINGDNPHTFITGTRNASFLVINPNSKELWATENSRDLLGDDIPPDEINILQANKHYGWPYCYGDQVRDTTFNTSTNFDCATTQKPIYKIQAHSAPLGLTFISSNQFPSDWQGDLLVAFHGSWNRSVPTGYKVVRLQVKGNTITNQEDFINFKSGELGRPVDVVFDQSGNLYVSDDKTGAVYIVQKL